jgi:hypothetical protein
MNIHSDKVSEDAESKQSGKVDPLGKSLAGGGQSGKIGESA